MLQELPTDEPRESRNPSLKTMIFIVAGLAAFFVAQHQIMKIGNRRRAATIASQPATPPVVTWRDKTFRAGDRVRIFKWAGTFKPDETGYRAQVDAAHGETGIVLRGERRVDSLHLDVDPKEPIQIVRVRWDAQRWKVNLKEEWVTLPPFEATIHVEHLELAPATTTSP